MKSKRSLLEHGPNGKSPDMSGNILPWYAFKTESQINQKVQVSIWSAIAMLLFVGTLSYRGMAISSESNRWVRHTHEVLENLQRLLLIIERIEGGSHGFVLTGDESYFDDYRTSLLNIAQTEQTIRNLTADNPEQQRQIPVLERLIAEKEQVAESLINLRRARGLDAAAGASRGGQDAQIMDKIQASVGQMQDEELRLLKLREADAKHSLAITNYGLVLGTILGLLITFTAAWSVRRDSFRRGLAEEAYQGSEEKNRMLLDGIHDYAIFMLDPDGRIASWNAGAERIKGYTAEQIIGHHFSRFFSPEDIHVGRPAEILRMTAANGRYEEQGMRVRKDGTRFLANITFTALRDPAGNLRGFSEISHDLSKRAEMEARYHGLLEAAPDAMVVTNTGGEIVLLNLRTEKKFGYNRDELLGQNVRVIIPDGFSERLIADGLRSLEEALAQQIGTGIELIGRRKNGSEFPIEIMLSPLENTEGILITAAIRDISARKDAEASIKYLNRVLSVLSGINTLIVRVNDHGRLFREACQIATEKGGFRMAMIVIVHQSTMLPVSIISAGKNEELLAAIKSVMSSSEGMQRTLVAQTIRERTAVISNDTQNDPRLLLGKHYTDAGINSMAVLPLIVSDVAVGALALYAGETNFFQKDEMRLLAELAGDIAYAIDHLDKQERLNYLAYYDALTGLANRSLFFDRVAQYIHSASSGGHKLAIGMIDMERFKNINDSMGRPAGDSLLKQMAEWLTQFTRDSDLLAHIEADHFAFVVPEVKTDGNLAKLVENLMATFLEHSFHLNDAIFRVGIKVGIALFPDDGADVDTVFMNAEAALKKAKTGGDRFLFYKLEMNEAVAGKLAMENQLRQAIDNEEFVLHYQPKVNLVSGKITGAEALIRWNDPRTGLVPPGQFIPILEETGLIYEVGRWALHQAIRDYLRWRAAGLEAVRIAVNVSPLQLRNINFIDEIRRVTTIDPHAAAGLELEITESLIMDNVEQNITSLQAIRTMGITIAIDDFGTGFSSLNYLSKLPVDTLKIDRSFVIEMNTPEGLALVSTIIVVAHALKLKVVAEGVETEQQSRQLLSLSCDEMQGYLFSKPVPADIFETRFLVLPAAA